MNNFNVVSPDSLKDKYELIVIGTGFGSSFFLLETLKTITGPILVLEWGGFNSWEKQLETQQNGSFTYEETYLNKSEKPWNTTIGFGGGTNCWFGQTPRFHPNDFKTKSLYGVGKDWPISYFELEPFYCEAETIMSISGDNDMTEEIPRSCPFPQPAHNGSKIDKVMKKAMPTKHFIAPTARARVNTDDRPACCSSHKCNFCPVQAKFTAINGFKNVYTAANVDICFESEVISLNSQNDIISSVKFKNSSKEYTVEGESFILGANGIQSPAILLRSNLDYAATGKGLHEQLCLKAEVYLDGLENFGGSTISTGINYSLNDGDFRKNHASCLINFENSWTYGLRKEYGRWRETLPLNIVAEDLRQDSNYVTIDPQSGRAVTKHDSASSYGYKGIENAFKELPNILSALPVEAIFKRGMRNSESHVQGTLHMGPEDNDSVVDLNQVHHRYRNLVVVGSSVFPSCSTANPSLTVAALSIRAARNYFK